MQSLCHFLEVMTFVLLTEYCDNLFVHLETQNLISLNGKLLKKVEQSRYRPGVAQRVLGS